MIIAAVIVRDKRDPFAQGSRAKQSIYHCGGEMDRFDSLAVTGGEAGSNHFVGAPYLA